MLLVLLCFLLPARAFAQEIEVELFEGGEGRAFYQRIAERTAGRRPGLKVALTCDPAISDKVRMRVLEGNFPEVTNANVDIWSLIEHGYVEPLDRYLDQPLENGSGLSWRETFLPGALTQYRSEGKTFGVPLVYVVWSVYYNKEMFEKNGWAAPQTWPDFFELCRKIKASGTAPIAFQGRYPFYARALVEHTFYHQAGERAFRDLQFGKPEAFRSEAMNASLQVLQRLGRDCFQTGFRGMSHTEAQLEFFQGRAAMLFCGSWLYSEMQDNIPEGFRLGAMSLPLPVSSWAKPGVEYAGSSYFFVFSRSKNPALGIDYLKILTSEEEAGKFAAERGIPVAVRGANRHLHPAMADVAEQISRLKDTFGPPAGPTVKGLDQIWNDSLGRVLAGEDIEEVRQDMARQAELAHLREESPDRVEVRHPVKALVFLLILFWGGTAALTVRTKERTLLEGRGDGSRLIFFVLPSVAVFSAFFAFPSLASLAAAAVEWDGLTPPKFVGLLHLKRLLLESDLFWVSLGHNLFLMVVPAILVVPLSLLLASLLHREVMGAKLFRVAFFFPNLLGVAGVVLWQQLYNPTVGPINRILVALGLRHFEGFAWLSEEHLYYALIPMAVWSAAGFNMLLFLAAMQAVPQSLYESAELMGANEWQKFRHITLPLIRDTLAVATVLMVIGGMKAFEAIWLLTNQQPSSQTHVVGTYMIRSLFVEQRIGQAAALATLLFVVVLVGSVLSNRLLESDDVG